MDWIEETKLKLKKKNKILFSDRSILLKDLAEALAGENRRVLILWAFDLAQQTAGVLEERYPFDTRPMRALEVCGLWAQGKVKMPEARRAILDCHRAAKVRDSEEDIALYHAVGQACSVVHTGRHAIGFPIYELTALVRGYGIEACREPVQKRVEEYWEKLRFWSTHEEQAPLQWAEFLR